jgi:hypothetical protein
MQVRNVKEGNDDDDDDDDENDDFAYDIEQL